MITLTDLYKTFLVKDKRTRARRRIEAVRGISLEVRPGEIYGLLGPNGAGKSTTLRMIAGLMRPDRGRIEVCGVDTVRSPERARALVGYLSTDLGVYSRFTPRELLKLFGEFQGVDARVAERRGVRLLEDLGLADFADIRMEGFSGGQKQKVSIARALLHDPKVVIFDEPTTGLDVLTAKTVLDLLRVMRGEGRSVVVSTHVMPMVEAVCDRVGIIFDGVLHGDAPPKEILARWGVASLDEVFFKLAEGERRVNGALLILKKEFMELSKDRKTLFFTFVMPLIIYPLIFFMMSRLGSHDAAARAGQPSRVCLTDPGRVFTQALRDDPRFLIVPRPAGDLRQAIRDQKLELSLEVDPAGAEKLARDESLDMRVLYDHSDESSKLALERFRSRLRQQETLWVQARLKRLGASPQLALPVKLETVEAGDMGLFLGKLIGSFLPYLLMIMMYAGAMQHGIYATAGEKERGTLLSLLATSMARTQIIIGKLLYIFSIGILSALVNLLSMALSVGRLMSSSGAAELPAQAAVTGVAALATPSALGLTFLLMVPLGLFFANFILLGGIQARNTLEASTALTPGIFVVVLLGVFSMAPGIEKMAWLPYVPVLNVSLAIRKLFSQQGNGFEYLVALVMTVVLAGLMTWISTRMLNRESAIFRV